jgi:phosphatidate cytidylyltransferase
MAEKKKGDLKTRVITALLLLPFVLYLLIWAPLPVLAVGLGLIAALSAREWARMSGLVGAAAWVYACVVVLLFAAVVGIEWQRVTGGLTTEQAVSALKTLMIAGVVVWAFVLTTQMRPGVTAPKLLRAFLGCAIIVIALSALLILRTLTGWQGVMFVISIVWVADVAAYFCGRRFGKVKLAPAISPGKTREGVYGALTFVAIYSAIVAATMPTVLSVKPQVSSFAQAFIGSKSAGLITLSAIVLGAVLLAMLSVAGDLYESLLKRQAGMKDSGTMLPGHGGILDRIDALLPVLPVAALAVLLVY